MKIKSFFLAAVFIISLFCVQSFANISVSIDIDKNVYALKENIVLDIYCSEYVSEEVCIEILDKTNDVVYRKYVADISNLIGLSAPNDEGSYTILVQIESGNGVISDEVKFSVRNISTETNTESVSIDIDKNIYSPRENIILGIHYSENASNEIRIEILDDTKKVVYRRYLANISNPIGLSAPSDEGSYNILVQIESNNGVISDEVKFSVKSIPVKNESVSIEIDKSVYSPRESIFLDIYYSGNALGESCVEILNAARDVVHRQYVTNIFDPIAVTAPADEGLYTLLVQIEIDDDYIISDQVDFSVQGSSVMSTNVKHDLSAVILTGENEKAIGIMLKWDGLDYINTYNIVRTEYDGRTKEYYDIDDTYFVDVNIDIDKTYKYYVYSGKYETKAVTISTSDIIPSEYMGKSSVEYVELTIGNPVMKVNGQKRDIYPGERVSPVIIDNRTMVPIRAIIESMNGRVEWNNDTQTVTLEAWGKNAKLTIDNKNIQINGSTISIDVPAKLLYDRTVVPIRVMEYLGCVVNYEENDRKVFIAFQK